MVDSFSNEQTNYLPLALLSSKNKVLMSNNHKVLQPPKKYCNFFLLTLLFLLHSLILKMIVSEHTPYLLLNLKLYKV